MTIMTTRVDNYGHDDNDGDGVHLRTYFLSSLHKVLEVNIKKIAQRFTDPGGKKKTGQKCPPKSEHSVHMLCNNG